MRSFYPVAYTLVELLVALTLSLLVLLAVTTLLSRVGGAMNDARSAMGTSANLHEAAILLRQDLARIPIGLATKPRDVANPNAWVDDRHGYLEIIEGPNGVFPYIYRDRTGELVPHPYVNEQGDFDPTVGDVDDIIAFTAIVKVGVPFRGLIANESNELQIAERYAAEIIWFVRGNTLYRRVRLIDDQRTNDPDVNTLTDLALRERRFGHDIRLLNGFPYPLYLFDDVTNTPGIWYYLRMPTLEENIHGSWNPALIDPDLSDLNPNPDLWEQPHFFPDRQDRKSGSLTMFTDNPQFLDDPRHVRAGEDVVLTNVLSFDIKVWCPDERDYVDLGTEGTTWDDSNNNQPLLPRTWDSWTRKYSEGDDYADHKNADGIVMPPYAEPLEAIQITIRCFDPASRAIKQVTIVHRFKD